MKKVSFLIYANIAIVLVAALMLGQYLVRRRPAGATARLVLGTVEVHHAGEDGYFELAGGDTVAGGDVIRSGEDGSIELIFPGGTRLALRPGSELALGGDIDPSPTSENQLFTLNRGVLFADLMPDKKAGLAYEVATPNAKASVTQPGTLCVRVGGDRSRFAVKQGQIVIDSTGPNGLTEKTVHARQVGIVRTAGVFDTPKLKDETYNDAEFGWFVDDCGERPAAKKR